MSQFLGGTDSKSSKVNKVAGVIAALSPQRHWKTNLKLAKEFIKAGEARHMPVFLKKARDIVQSDGSVEAISDILKGRKITSFFLNIVGDDESKTLTIDRHALSIALGKKTSEEDYRGITKNQYQFFVNAYIIEAKKVGVSPLLMQSSTWVRYRKLN